MRQTSIDEQLPEVVRVYRETGCSARGTAEKLKVSRHTIMRRVARAIELGMLSPDE